MVVIKRPTTMAKKIGKMVGPYLVALNKRCAYGTRDSGCPSACKARAQSMKKGRDRHAREMSQTISTIPPKLVILRKGRGFGDQESWPIDSICSLIDFMGGKRAWLLSAFFSISITRPARGS